MKKSKKEKKKAKKEMKQNKKLRAKVIEAFPFKDEKIIEALTKSVKLNKAVLHKDEEMHKAWQEDYFQRLFVDFKELVRKHNEALNVEAEKLTMKIDGLKLQVREYENKVKKLKVINKLIKENA